MCSCNHHEYMSLALRLAALGRMTVSPNPMVGCVIVKNNQVVGQGYHRRAGEPHAEIFALNDAGPHADGATAYVTLEPCCHQGRTGACTAALINAGIKKIYVACIDPNSQVAGRGLEKLRAAGISVEVGWCAAEAIKLNEVFFHYIIQKRPLVLAKWAMSLDGKTVTHLQDSKKISGLAAQQHAHQFRQQFDAILIGANTALQDDPQLTARVGLEEAASKQPVRVVLTGHQKLPHHLKLFNTPHAQTILVVTPNNQHLFCNISAKNVELLRVPEDAHAQISLPALLDALGERQITSLLVEGGMTVHESFFRENLVNKIQVYLSPWIIGGLANKKWVDSVDFSQKGRDFFFTANLKETQNV